MTRATGMLAGLVLAGTVAAAQAEEPTAAYGLRPLVKAEGEGRVIAIIECADRVVPIYDGLGWCAALASGCWPGRVWMMDQTRNGPPLEQRQANPENIPIPPWCRK